METLQRSRLGPLIRSGVSVARLPLWRWRNSPPPAPPHSKRAVVASFARRVRPDTFVETGTYRGDTLARIRPLVARCISIELDPTLASAAQRRFAKYGGVEVRVGDSAIVLAEVVRTLSGSALFWLDGHYSGGVTADSGKSPIIQELTSILASELDATILVDDARLFDGSDGYPTVSEVVELIKGHQPDLHCVIEDDIIRVTREAELQTS